MSSIPLPLSLSLLILISSSAQTLFFFLGAQTAPQISVHSDCPSDYADDERSHLFLGNQSCRNAKNLKISDLSIGVKSHHHISSTRLFGQICSIFHVWFFMMFFAKLYKFFLFVTLRLSD
ncbi:hypothetical protein CsSME_00037509 [Camellia sinensis var. sinensis]